jgi:hypothetical protein
MQVDAITMQADAITMQADALTLQANALIYTRSVAQMPSSPSPFSQNWEKGSHPQYGSDKTNRLTFKSRRDAIYRVWYNPILAKIAFLLRINNERIRVIKSVREYSRKC